MDLMGVLSIHNLLLLLTDVYMSQECFGGSVEDVMMRRCA